MQRYHFRAAPSSKSVFSCQNFDVTSNILLFVSNEAIPTMTGHGARARKAPRKRASPMHPRRRGARVVPKGVTPQRTAPRAVPKGGPRKSPRHPKRWIQGIHRQSKSERSCTLTTNKLRLELGHKMLMAPSCTVTQLVVHRNSAS